MKIKKTVEKIKKAARALGFTVRSRTAQTGTVYVDLDEGLAFRDGVAVLLQPGGDHPGLHR